MEKREKKKLNMKKQWAKFIIVMVCYLLFLYWVKSWLGLLVVPFIYDAYISKKINWKWWQDLEGPMRSVMSWVDAIVFALVAVYFINQFFYFPLDNPDRSGKKSLAYTLWDAMAEGQIPIFADDELTIPLDHEIFVRRYTKPDTIVLEIGYDDDDNEEYQTIIRPNDFDGADIIQYGIREAWFIGKQDSRQDSRRLALAPMKKYYRKFANTDEELFLGTLPLFWVPMQHPSVRHLLAQSIAYTDANNLIGRTSWDWVFVNQYYSAYITRESNRYLRTINQYLTGEDAILESERIEDKIFNIENDMWEY